MEDIQVTCKPLSCKTHFIPTKLDKPIKITLILIKLCRPGTCKFDCWHKLAKPLLGNKMAVYDKGYKTVPLIGNPMLINLS